MTYPKDKLGNYVDFTNGKTSPERYDQGRYAVFGSNGEIGRSDQKNSPESTTVIGRVGSCGSVHFSARPCWVTDNAIKAISKKPAEGRFWYFALFNQKLHDLRSGSAQPLINQTSLKAVELPVPDQTARLQIGELLGSLDDKIELNRRMNETLEEMARALFRDWFIDFGPTRRQMDGATDPAAIMGHAFPDNKAAILAPLFPARLGEKGLPEGWKMGTLKDYGIVKNGFAFKSKDWRDIGIPVLKIKNVKPRLVSLDGCGFIDIGLARKKSNFQLQSGDILVGMTGYVGEVGRVPETKLLPMLNQRVGHIKAEYLEGFSPFIFSCTRQPEFKEHAVARSHGSAQANVSTKDLELFEVVIAGKTIVAAYDQFATPIFDRMQLADTENKTLADMRDLLLPKLMSGEIQLKDAWRDL